MVLESNAQSNRAAFSRRIAFDCYTFYHPLKGIADALTNKDMSREAATYPIVEQARVGSSI